LGALDEMVCEKLGAEELDNFLFVSTGLFCVETFLPVLKSTKVNEQKSTNGDQRLWWWWVGRMWRIEP